MKKIIIVKSLSPKRELINAIFPQDDPHVTRISTKGNHEMLKYTIVYLLIFCMIRTLKKSPYLTQKQKKSDKMMNVV